MKTLVGAIGVLLIWLVAYLFHKVKEARKEHEDNRKMFL
jgi:hypothetical protein